jgi:hypothetical protein
MALFAIPTSEQFTWYTRAITLTGQAYTLEIRYNSRLQRWLMSILDRIQNPILLSIPLLINRNLTQQYATLSIPEGMLYCVDETGQQLEPVLSSFLTSHTLYYFDNQA